MAQVPSFFHSLEHDAPFSECISCQRSFLDIPEPYSITKAFNGAECIFEYALCRSCHESLHEEFSEESKQSLQRFFDKRVDLSKRAEKFEGIDSHAPWLEKCVTCNSPVSECKEYSTACMAYGDELVFDPFPMMVCGNCNGILQSSLSQSTRDRRDRFIKDHFPGPPANTNTPVFV